MNEFYSTHAQCRIRYQDLPGIGPACVFVHGLGCAASYEYPRVVCDPLFGGRRAILLDLAGYGYSERPLHFAYGTTDQAQIITELADHLALDKFYVYGHSMGGSIAIEAATRLGERVLGLMLSESNLDSGGGLFSRQIVQADEASFIRTGYAELLAAEKKLWAGCLQSAAPYALWRSADSLVRGIKPDWRTLLYRLNCRKIYFFGEYSLPDKDFIALPEHGVSVAVIPKAGHSMSWENPAGLAHGLAEYMSSA